MGGSQFSLHWAFTELFFFRRSGISKRHFTLRLRSLLHTLARLGLWEREGSTPHFTVREPAAAAELCRCKMNEGFPANVSVPSAVCLWDGAKGRRRSDAEWRLQATSLLLTHEHDPEAAAIRMAPSSQRGVAENRRPGSAPYSRAPA